MNSALYTGEVAHIRTRPKRNGFRYGIYFLLLDIDQIGAISSRLKLLSYNRAGVFSFHDRDHGPRDGSALRPWINEVLLRAGIDLAGGRVFLLTFPRVLGSKFYPASFWYCFDSDGAPRAVLAEVNNTFKQHHFYLLHNDGNVFDWNLKPEKQKVFHVSPFIEMDARYRFSFSEPGEALSLSIHDFVEGPLLLVASVGLKARPLSDSSLLATLLRYGPMSMRAWILIHYQAIRIVAKKIRYIPKPALPSEELT